MKYSQRLAESSITNDLASWGQYCTPQLILMHFMICCYSKQCPYTQADNRLNQLIYLEQKLDQFLGQGQRRLLEMLLRPASHCKQVHCPALALSLQYLCSSHNPYMFQLARHLWTSIQESLSHQDDLSCHPLL